MSGNLGVIVKCQCFDLIFGLQEQWILANWQEFVTQTYLVKGKFKHQEVQPWAQVILTLKPVAFEWDQVVVKSTKTQISEGPIRQWPTF